MKSQITFILLCIYPWTQMPVSNVIVCHLPYTAILQAQSERFQSFLIKFEQETTKAATKLQDRAYSHQLLYPCLQRVNRQIPHMVFNSENTCFLEKFMLQSCKLNMNIYPLLYADFYLTTFLTTTLKNTSKKSSREERLFDHSFDHNHRKNVWNQWSSEFRKPCNIVNKRTKTSRKN